MSCKAFSTEDGSSIHVVTGLFSGNLTDNDVSKKSKKGVNGFSDTVCNSVTSKKTVFQNWEKFSSKRIKLEKF